MKKLLYAIALVFIAALSVASQTTTPIPTPPVDNDVVKISTNLIQVDVTVTDKKGVPIRDLRPDEVEIYENGKLQKISHFNFVPGTRLPAKTAAEIKADKKAANEQVYLPAGPIRPESVRRTIALVADDLSLSFGSIVWVKDALKKFVNEQMQEGDLVAIIRTGAGIGALQQFTNDKRRLLAAIDKVKFNMSGSGRVGIFDPLSTTAKDAKGASDDPNAEAISQKLGDIAKESDRTVENFSTSIFVSGTLGALNFVVRGMKDLPGRKSIVLMSDGFSLVSRDSNNNARQSQIIDPLRRLIDFANRNSVVFYSIDARGLVAPILTAEDDPQGLREDPMVTSRIMDQRSNTLTDSQDGPRFLSEHTGGFSIINNNDISGGVRKILDDQSYYLVAYVPNDETFDRKNSRYNTIDVKVKRPNTKTRFRSGFFAVASENITNKQDPTAAIVDAITSPFTASGIMVRMNALFVGDAKRGLNMRAFVNIDPKDITFTKQPDGKYKGVFDFFAMTYGDNGTVQDQRYSRATVLVAEDEYKLIQKRGLVSDYVVGVKKPGGYQLRLAIRDKVTGKVGSASQFVMVPDLGKRQLSVSGAVLTTEPVKRPGRSGEGQQKVSDPEVETSIKQFRTGSILRYDYYVYNAKVDPSHKADLSYKLRLYRDGKVVFAGDQMPLLMLDTDPSGTVSTSGIIQLGDDLIPGDYILQAEITDKLAGKKNNTVNQFVQFEIVQ